MTRTFLLFSLTCLSAFAELRVAVLHPLLGDLAREVGGPEVEVIDLLGADRDPHHFAPTPAQLRDAGKLDLVLACGLGLEADLATLRELLPAPLIEIGAELPTLAGGCDHPEHQHAPDERDPHWWHSVDRFRRAVTVVEKHFTESDPDHAADYASRAQGYRQQLDELGRWVRREVARIPRSKRVLATSHAAFGYFCHDHGFEAVSVQGLTREQMPDAASLARTFAELREQRVTVVFPEKGANPATLRALVHDGGLRLAQPLDADGTYSSSYVEMMRSNVDTIHAGLTGS